MLGSILNLTQRHCATVMLVVHYIGIWDVRLHRPGSEFPATPDKGYFVCMSSIYAEKTVKMDRVSMVSCEENNTRNCPLGRAKRE